MCILISELSKFVIYFVCVCIKISVKLWAPPPPSSEAPVQVVAIVNPVLLITKFLFLWKRVKSYPHVRARGWALIDKSTLAAESIALVHHNDERNVLIHRISTTKTTTSCTGNPPAEQKRTTWLILTNYLLYTIHFSPTITIIYSLYVQQLLTIHTAQQ